MYARKSSESEDKQMASIDSQITELKRMADQDGLEVVDIFSESMSAKDPGRPVFAKMLERIRGGEASGILCWKLNRLARNPIDGGQISWLLQQGALQHIQTFGRGYYPTDNVIVMAVELGMANQFIRDLSVDTKRGLRSKAERGWYPTYASIGYKHNPLKLKGEKEIIVDEERFHLVRKLFDEVLSGTPISKVREVANEEWGLRNKREQKISRSNIYRILSDPFYYGEFEYPKGSNNWYQGAHQPVITQEEFNKIQVILGKKGKPRPKKHDFAFRGPITCGECGAMITAESKIKKQKNGNIHFYTYYHCTKKKNPDCSQKNIEEKELEKQVIEVLESIEIPKEFYVWAISKLKASNKIEIKQREHIVGNQRREYDTVIKKLDGLIDMRANRELSEADFIRRKESLTTEKEQLHSLLNEANKRMDEWLEIADNYFKFASEAKINFEKGDIQIKKNILSALGSNLTLKNGKLNVSLEKPLLLIKGGAKEARDIEIRLEPLKTAEDQAVLSTMYSKSSILLRG